MAQPPLQEAAQADYFNALFAQTRDLVLLARISDGHILSANPSALAAFGRQFLEADPVLQDLPVPQQQAAFKRKVSKACKGTEPVPFSGRLQRNDGSIFHCEMKLRRIEEDTLLLTIHDISERVRALEDIELRNIAIANVTSGVTVADARQPDLPLIYVNRGFQEITGYSAREAVGRSCRFLQSGDRDQPELDKLREALRTGEACIVQLRNYRKDGSLFMNELHISPVHNEEGELTHFVGIQLDVTEQVEARKSLERSEKRYRQALAQEKELNEIKTRFISMVSHEFRTPMTGIMASAALLRKFGDRLDPEKKERHLANITISLKRMNRLLDDVLFFSRAESGKLQVERSPIRLDEHFPALLESLALVYPDRRVNLDCRLDPPSTFMLDAHLLDHILHNLIGNAIKYSPPTSEVACRIYENETGLVIEVSDQGIGIPPKDQTKLFEAFHRADNVGTRHGTGLGLNIVQRAVELLEGDINFVSNEGRGSTFTVRLPKLVPHGESSCPRS